MHTKFSSKKKSVKKVFVSLFLVTAIIITCAFAFLTAQDSKMNVFTIGNVDIELQEDGWEIGNDGKYKRTDDSNFNMEPGADVEKAPKIKNTGTNEAWVYMTVGVPIEKADNIYQINGITNFKEDPCTIEITGYAIQNYYKDLDNAESIWESYFKDLKETRFGSPYTGADAGTFIELFSLNNINSGWTLIDDPYMSSDGHIYYIYSYGLLSTDTTTEPLFETVTLLDSIGNPATGQVTFAGYYDSDNTFHAEEKTLTWTEIVMGVDADKYNYGEQSYVQTHSEEFGLKDLLDNSDLIDSNHISLDSSVSYSKIGYGAFYNTTVTNIVIPSGLKTIGLEAFSDCDMLTDITIPDSVSVISAGAFGMDSALTSIKLSNNIQVVEPMTFFKCTNLSNVTIGTNTKEIKDMAFYGCNIDNLIITEAVETIGPVAFAMNPLETIQFKGNNLKHVDFYAFVSDIDSPPARLYTIPDNLPAQSISLYAFSTNSTLENANFVLSSQGREQDYINNGENSVFFDDYNAMTTYFSTILSAANNI